MERRRFKTRHPRPNAYQREILTILIEECAEVIQRATKLLRFGVLEVQPRQHLTNAERLAGELADLDVLVDMAREEGLVGPIAIELAKANKREKLAYFMQEDRTE